MKNVFRFVAVSIDTVGELCRFFWKRKLWWMIPMAAILLLSAVLLILAQASGAGPFVYPPF